MNITDKNSVELYPFLNNVTNDDIVLTPNLRLARHLHQAYAEKQNSKQQTCWETPKILSSGAWLQSLWAQLIDKGILLPWVLNTQQAQHLWYNIISQHELEQPLLNIRQTVKHAHSALQTLFLWEQDLKNINDNLISEHYPYYQWAEKFLHICQENDCIITEAMPGILQQHIKEIDFEAMQLYTVAFDDIPPAHESFYKKCETFIRIHTRDTQKAQSDTQVKACQDTNNEILEMALWAKYQLEHGANSVGCVVSDLQGQRAQLERVFSEQFIDSDYYNISSGEVFSEVPLIYTALQICRLDPRDIDSNNITLLLLSPFIGGSEKEKVNRALLDKAIREKAYHHMTLARLIEFCRKDQHYCPVLIKMLLHYENMQGDDFEQSPSRWAKRFSIILHDMGWPGERLLNSYEFQAMNRWQQLLHEFASLEYIKPSMTLKEALSELHHLASSSIFQIQTTDAPVQVLGTLEAAGIQFSHLWVMGLTDEVWPQSPSPNPFLPRTMQRELNMPHSSAEREWEFANKLTHRLSHSADKVIFSYSQFENDKEYMPSPLIAQFKITTQVEQATLNDVVSTLYQSRLHEKYYEHLAPSISDDEDIRGGSFILKHQAQCPFRSFAIFRLHADAIENPGRGIDSMTRGILLHNALEYIWTTLKDQTNLLRLSKDELSQLIDCGIDYAIHHIDQQRFSDKFIQLEKLRVKPLIEKWLAIEAQRKPFKVKAIEYSKQLTIAGLSMKLRVDRIDVNERGQEIVIDYKTGRVNLYECFSERIKEPQLVLYALSDGAISAISYAQIRADKISYQGIGCDEFIDDEIIAIEKYRYSKNQTWDEQIKSWRDKSEQLAKEFLDGFAAVLPQFSDSCAFCDLESLCRINELSQRGELNHD